MFDHFVNKLVWKNIAYRDENTIVYIENRYFHLFSVDYRSNIYRGIYTLTYIIYSMPNKISSTYSVSWLIRQKVSKLLIKVLFSMPFILIIVTLFIVLLICHGNCAYWHQSSLDIHKKKIRCSCRCISNKFNMLLLKYITVLS